MKTLGLAVAVIGAGLCVTAGSGPAHAVLGGEAIALEAARANARAGGPVSERDAELLRKYGCLSGTANPICGSDYRRGDRSQRRRKRQHED